MAVLRPDQMMKCSIPVVMAGIIAVRPTKSKNVFLLVFISDVCVRSMVSWCPS